MKNYRASLQFFSFTLLKEFAQNLALKACMYFAFLFALSMLWACPLRAEDDSNPSILASRSKILKATGIRIVPALIEDGKVLIFKQPTSSKLEARLLSASGDLLELSGDPSKTAIPEKFECGQAPAAALKTKNGRLAKGEFVALGNRIAEVVKWIPAKKETGHVPACVRPKNKFQKEKLEVFTTSAKDIRIFIGTWLEPPTQQQMKDWCVGKPDFKTCMEERKNGINEAYDQGYYQYRRSGILYGNSCEVLTTLDVDPYPYGKGMGEGTNLGLTGFLGTLLLTNKTEKEIWLLFDGPGYESRGVEAYLLNETSGKIDVKNPYSITFDGC